MDKVAVLISSVSSKNMVALIAKLGERQIEDKIISNLNARVQLMVLEILQTLTLPLNKYLFFTHNQYPPINKIIN